MVHFKRIAQLSGGNGGVFTLQYSLKMIFLYSYLKALLLSLLFTEMDYSEYAHKKI